MIRFRGRALSVTLAAVLALSTARVAVAVEERAWLSLEAGANLYDPEQGLTGGPAFGLPPPGFFNRWGGGGGLYHPASPHQDPPSPGGAPAPHYRRGLLPPPPRRAWGRPSH